MTDRIKQAIRQRYRCIREKLPTSYQQKASTEICARIQRLEKYRDARHIAFYHACRHEVDLHELWQVALLDNKICYFPKINDDKQLSFLPVLSTTNFVSNRFAIPEPDVDLSQAIAANNLDLIFMPLVAFDEHGTRIGMGGGYYDRTLSSSEQPLLIGVAYDFQREPYLKPQKWDVPLDAIVTQTCVYQV
jgi:5-formyltetrahydrofolate cyclo-ligase